MSEIYADSIEAKVDGTNQIVPIRDITKAPAIIASASGESIQLSDSGDAPLTDIKLYGKSEQDGTPSIENPVEIAIPGIDGSITLTISDGAENQQSLTVSTPNGLPGIPVEAGGNYTDEDGQQWICDEIDFEEGKYTKNCNIITVDESSNISLSFTNEFGINNFRYNADVVSNKPRAICNALKEQTELAANVKDEGFLVSSYVIYIRLKATSYPDVETLKTYLKSSPLMFIVQKPVTSVTDISSEEISAYKQLFSNYPNTNVFNDGTPQAGMEVTYTADTKMYIDNKFEELQSSLANTQSTLLEV